MTAELQRDLGKHDAQIEALERDMQEMKADLRRLFDKLDQINNTLSEAKGGWRTMMWIAGASAAAGGLIAKFLPFFNGR
jgi:chromosome segregation ATPase